MLIIAYLSMFVDHVFKFAITANMQHNPIFGRIAMPIFMYMLAMGIGFLVLRSLNFPN